MVEIIVLVIFVPIWIISALLVGASLTVGLLTIHVVVVPLIFKYSKTFRRILIFANFIQWPLFMDYENPKSCGIEGARNLAIQYQSKVDNCPVKIGVWHILPKTVYERLKGKFVANCDKVELNRVLDEELSNCTTPVMLYCHGNSNSRGATHRIKLYRFFQQMEFHTIAFDYRGYGDSTNIRPTEAGVVEDSLIVYEWLHNTLTRAGRNQTAPLFVWGHSLGTGISSSLLGNLASLSGGVLGRAAPLPPPRGLILEAPFNNLPDELKHIPICKLVKWLPYFDTTFVEPFRQEKDFQFRSDTNLARLPKLPILILHAKDDVIIPFIVGFKLYRAIAASRSPSDALVKLHAYDKSLELGHKWICTAKDLPQVVGEFVASHS